VIKTNLHLGFTGNCDAAFAFYETVFDTKRLMTMVGRCAPGSTVPGRGEGSRNAYRHADWQHDADGSGCAPRTWQALRRVRYLSGRLQRSRSEAPLRRAERRRQRDDAARPDLLVTPCSACARTSSASTGWSASPDHRPSPGGRILFQRCLCAIGCCFILPLSCALVILPSPNRHPQYS